MLTKLNCDWDGLQQRLNFNTNLPLNRLEFHFPRILLVNYELSETVASLRWLFSYLLLAFIFLYFANVRINTKTIIGHKWYSFRNVNIKNDNWAATKKNTLYFSRWGWENFAPDLFAAVSIALQQIYCDNVFLGLTYHWIKKKKVLSRHTTCKCIFSVWQTINISFKKIITIVNEIVSSLSLYVSPCPLYNAYQYILRVESTNEKKSTFAFTWNTNLMSISA